MSSLIINDAFKTIRKNASAEIKIKKSIFIAQAFPVNSTDEVREKILNVKKEYFDARHHPFAYRIGYDRNRFRFNDDGEPSGSAGKPILEAMDRFLLTNILIIVTRYFGGIKLGTGGLRRAYYDSALLSLNENNIEERFIYEEIKLEFKFDYINYVMNFIEKHKIKILENNSEEFVKYICDVRLSMVEKLKEELLIITNGSIKFS